MVAPETVDRLVLRRQLDAPPAVVFKVWTEPDHMRNWFGPSPEFTNPFIEVDLRQGGRYRIAFLAPDGVQNVVGGEFLHVEPPKKLVYTWQWEPPNEHAGHETQVTVEFLPRGGGTELVLTHDRIPDQAMRQSHEKGWSGALDRLPTEVSRAVAKGG